MGDELLTKACLTCGWPALATTRRCPYCREPFPRPRTIRARAPSDTLGWLAVGWLLALLPAVILAYGLFGFPFAALAVGVALGPAFAVWALRQRTAMRIGRLGGRGGSAPRTQPGRGRRGPANPTNRSEDARRR